MSDSILFDLLIVAAFTAVMGLLSYYDLPKKPDKLTPQETRASRALTDAYTYAVIVGLAIAGTHIGDTNGAPHLGVFAGALAGGAVAILTRGIVARTFVGAARKR